MLHILQTALELGFLYALIPMALFLSFRVLDIADMTTDGCFVLGTAVSVTMAAARTSVPGHPRGYGGRRLRRFRDRIPADPPGRTVHPGRNRYQYGTIYD